MNKRIGYLLLTFCILIQLTGCWNNQDLRDLAISSGFGIDLTDDGKVMVSVQIIKPASAKTSGTDGSGGGDKKGFVVVTNTADTIFGALREMLSKVNNRIFFSSSQIIIIGESAARAGIGEYIDFIMRDHETQYKTLVAVAKGTTAKKILEQEFDLSKVPGAYIRDTLKNADFRAFNKNIILLEMARELATEGKELSIGTISITGNTTSAEGMAVFLKSKMVGWLDSFETRGYMFATGRVKSTIVEVNELQGAKKQTAVEILKTSVKNKLEWNEGGKPVININIKIEANIAEQYAGGISQETEFAKKLASSCNQKIKNEVLMAISKCQQEYKSDIFGFGSMVFNHNTGYWNSVKDKWNQEIFPYVDVRVNVKTDILRSGLLDKPIDTK